MHIISYASAGYDFKEIDELQDCQNEYEGKPI